MRHLQDHRLALAFRRKKQRQLLSGKVPVLGLVEPRETATPGEADSNAAEPDGDGESSPDRDPPRR